MPCGAMLPGRQAARRLLNIRTHSAMAAGGGCFCMDTVRVLCRAIGFAWREQMPKDMPRLKLQPLKPAAPSDKLRASVTQLRVHIYRAGPRPYPLSCSYLLAVPLECGSRLDFDVSHTHSHPQKP